jgi:hypothetical protein
MSVPASQFRTTSIQSRRGQSPVVWSISSTRQIVTIFAAHCEGWIDRSYLLGMASPIAPMPLSHEARATMLASERVLARDWLRPEEDEAWADL